MSEHTNSCFGERGTAHTPDPSGLSLALLTVCDWISVSLSRSVCTSHLPSTSDVYLSTPVSLSLCPSTCLSACLPPCQSSATRLTLRCCSCRRSRITGRTERERISYNLLPNGPFIPLMNSFSLCFGVHMVGGLSGFTVPRGGRKNGIQRRLKALTGAQLPRTCLTPSTVLIESRGHTILIKPLCLQRYSSLITCSLHPGVSSRPFTICGDKATLSLTRC